MNKNTNTAIKKIYVLIAAVVMTCFTTPVFASETCNHQWSDWEETLAKSWATRDEDTGIMEYGTTKTETKTCSICQKEETRNTITDYQTIIEKHPATCTESGYAVVDHNGVTNRITTSKPLGHNFQTTGKKLEEKITDANGACKKRIYDSQLLGD